MTILLVLRIKQGKPIFNLIDVNHNSQHQKQMSDQTMMKNNFKKE